MNQRVNLKLIDLDDGAFQRLAPPVGDLLRMDVKLLRQFGWRLLGFDHG
jgi:hypothetical protein